MRGDGPVAYCQASFVSWCSPRARGWSCIASLIDGRDSVFPASVGMARCNGQCRSGSVDVPRMRGDGPYFGVHINFGGGCSPHPRGWSQRNIGIIEGHINVPRASGDGSASLPIMQAARRALWASGGGPKEAHSAEPFALAGIWGNWKRPGTEDWVRMFAVIKTNSNEIVDAIHDWMPVIRLRKTTLAGCQT